jgi:hypothetical protein
MKRRRRLPLAKLLLLILFNEVWLALEGEECFRCERNVLIAKADDARGHAAKNKKQPTVATV